jgi:hypothetical protein
MAYIKVDKIIHPTYTTDLTLTYDIPVTIADYITELSFINNSNQTYQVDMCMVIGPLVMKERLFLATGETSLYFKSDMIGQAAEHFAIIPCSALTFTICYITLDVIDPVESINIDLRINGQIWPRYIDRREYIIKYDGQLWVTSNGLLHKLSNIE